MCLSAEAFALFLSILSPEIITSTPGAITIHATTQNAVWLRVGDRWCTDAV